MGAVLVWLGEGNIDHQVYFSSRKFFDVENNYTTTKHEGLVMVYALQKFFHCLLETPFKLFTYHSALKYLFNKPVLGGRICHWFFFFQESEFEVVLKLGKYNVGLDHLSQLETREASRSLDDKLPDVKIF
jgi:hypothetical protein